MHRHVRNCDLIAIRIASVEEEWLPGKENHRLPADVVRCAGSSR